jgi:hypothetical protein
VAETGDPAVVGSEVVGLFVAVDDDPYRLMEQAAQSVMARVGTGRLRREKPLPAFVDTFGWCTWEAFYQDVSHDKVREGLQSFAGGGRIAALPHPRRRLAKRANRSDRRKTAERLCGQRKVSRRPRPHGADGENPSLACRHFSCGTPWAVTGAERLAMLWPAMAFNRSRDRSGQASCTIGPP